MPLEAATYISDLVPANPIHTDPLSQADSHMRLTKQVLKNTFPNVSSAVSATGGDLSHGFVPVGGVIMWTGSLASIPAGWLLCDGTSGVPDLRDRFVVAAGGSYSPAAVGGSAATSFDGFHSHLGSVTDAQGTHTHATAASGSSDAVGSHSHGGITQSHVLTISEIPAHNHFGGGTLVSSPGTGTFWTSIPLSTTQPLSLITETTTGGGAGHTHGISADGNHTHAVTVAGGTDATGLHAHSVVNTGDGGHGHTVTPPYFALYFIIRIF
jgi:hypothetical protein